MGRTCIANNLADLFQFDVSVQLTPLEDYDGAMSQFVEEKQFEFKCYLESHSGEYATNIKHSLDYSCYSEYEVNNRKYSKVTQINSLPKYFLTVLVRQDFDNNKASKILRKISFSQSLDL